MSKREFYVSCDDTSLSFCCGVIELGDFTARIAFRNLGRSGVDVDNYNTSMPLSKAEKEELKHLWKNKIEDFLEHGRPLLLTVVKYPGRNEYENQCLVDAINEHPGALDCGSSVNPGSGNTVTVYMIYPPKKGKK